MFRLPVESPYGAAEVVGRETDVLEESPFVDKESLLGRIRAAPMSRKGDDEEDSTSPLDNNGSEEKTNKLEMFDSNMPSHMLCKSV